MHLMPQIIRSPKVYAVCIVGSGAAGAAAKVLAEGPERDDARGRSRPKSRERL